MDEAGIQEYIYRAYAKSRKGTRVCGKISGRRYVRQTIISALNAFTNKLIAPFIFQGNTDTSLVLFWVEKFLLPELPSNSTIIWDNASFHKSPLIRELLKSNGHSMIVLPAYSPELNAIEHKWHELKARLRKYYDNTTDFLDNLVREIRTMSMFIGD